MKVVTAVVNNPIFIQIQYYTLKKYMKCDYEFIVFNDAKIFSDYSNGGDLSIKIIIEDMCKRLGITYIDIPNNHHILKTDPALRCADSMNFILNYQIKNPDKYLLIDSDMFLIDYFDIADYENYDCAIVLQSRNNERIKYFWNGIYYFDLNKMNNINLLNWNCSPGCDVGGMMQEWLKEYSLENDNKIYYIKHLPSCTWNNCQIPENFKKNNRLIDFLNSDPRNKEKNFYCEIYDNKFLHYRAGGNCENLNMKIHVELSKQLRDVILY